MNWTSGLDRSTIFGILILGTPGGLWLDGVELCVLTNQPFHHCFWVFAFMECLVRGRSTYNQFVWIILGIFLQSKMNVFLGLIDAV